MKALKALLKLQSPLLGTLTRKAVYQKAMVAGSMAVCLTMGQNCAPTNFSGGDDAGIPAAGLGAADPVGPGGQDSHHGQETPLVVGDQATINLPASGDGGPRTDHPPSETTTAQNPPPAPASVDPVMETIGAPNQNTADNQQPPSETMNTPEEQPGTAPENNPIPPQNTADTSAPPPENPSVIESPAEAPPVENPPQDIATNPAADTPPVKETPVENPPAPQEPAAQNPPEQTAQSDEHPKGEEPEHEKSPAPGHDDEISVCADINKIERNRRDRYVSRVDDDHDGHHQHEDDHEGKKGHKSALNEHHHEANHDEHHEKGDRKHGHVAVMICHKGRQTLTVDIQGALHGHAKHGDYIGECGKPAIAECQVAKIEKKEEKKEARKEERKEEPESRVKHGDHHDEGGHCSKHADRQKEEVQEREEHGTKKRAENERHDRKGRS